MSDMASRREIILGTASIGAGIVGYHVATDGAQATEVNVDSLDVADKDAEISSSLSGVSITVDGDWSIDSGKVPSKLVLRVEGRVNDTKPWQQLAATDWRNGLNAEMSKSFSLTGNLLDLEGLSASDLNPTETGNSKSQTVQIRVKFEVFHDNQKSETHTVSDSAQITVTKTLAQTNVSIDAQGNMSVSES